MDKNSISEDPLFASITENFEDFHLMTTARNGRFNILTHQFDSTDSLLSPSIDAGDPTSSFDVEPKNNGGRINQGADGNTAEASQTPKSHGSDDKHK